MSNKNVQVIFGKRSSSKKRYRVSINQTELNYVINKLSGDSEYI